jgi:hypothetical protein
MILFSFWLFGDKKCISLKEEEKNYYYRYLELKSALKSMSKADFFGLKVKTLFGV